MGKWRSWRIRFNPVSAITVLMMVWLTIGFASVAGSTEINDPWEGMNRKIFGFNEGVDRWLFEPVAKGWDLIMPDLVERSIDRFFENARFPIRFVNDILQFKPVHAAEDLGRFIVNTSLGIGGLFDPATHLGIDKNREDFGQTLGVWGIPSGPYLVLPILGPSNPRDAIGLIGDAAAQPHQYFLPFWVTSSIRATDYLNSRSLNLDTIAAERASALDFYVLVRNVYMKKRENLVHDRDGDEKSGDSAEDEELYYPGDSKDE